MTIEVPTYAGNMPLDQIEDVHALPSSVQNDMKQVHRQHGRNQSLKDYNSTQLRK